MSGTIGSRIVATGCTSGLGFHAVKQLLRSPQPTLPPPFHVILLARNATAAHAVRARDELQAMTAAYGNPVSSDIELRDADLTSLASVRRAGESILADVASQSTASTRQIAPGRIDLVLLNAAAAKSNKQLVTDKDHRAQAALAGQADALCDEAGRYEETACVNHVAQQLLLSILSPQLLSQQRQRDSSRLEAPRVVFTGSALHRRLSDVEDLDFFFDPRQSSTEQAESSTGHAQRREWSLIKSYGASKFLQMLGVQHLIRLVQGQPSATQNGGQCRLEVVVVQPGFIPNTGLNRESSLLGRAFMAYVMPWLPFSFISTVQEGATNIAEACARRLDSFPVATSNEGSKSPVSQAPESGDTATWLQDHPPVKAGVRKALIVKGGVREAPDHRTEDATLAAKWWPSAVDKAWLSGSTSTRS